MKLADERHRHAVKTVTCAEAVNETELRAEQLRAAAKSGNRAGDDEAGEHAALHANPVETAGRHVIADRTQAEACTGPEERVVQNETDRNGDDQSPCEPHPGHQTRQMDRISDRRRLRNRRVADPAGIEDAHEQCRHIVEHDGDDHLILSARDFENARDHAPEAARQCARQQRQHDTAKPGHAGKITNQERRDGTHQELTLAAQVKHTAFIGKARA